VNYWDTSCLLKLYVREPDSAQYLMLVKEQTAPVFTSVLAEVEFAFALTRKEAEGNLKKGAAVALVQALRDHAAQGRIRFLPISSAVRDLAATLARRCMIGRKPILPLRTLDGIHLATAIEWRATHLLTADIRLQEAACFCGLSTLTGVHD